MSVTTRSVYGAIRLESPGDQEYPVYHHRDIQRVIANGVQWAAPRTRTRTVPQLDGPVVPSNRTRIALRPRSPNEGQAFR